MKIEKHPSGIMIMFDPKWHSYKNLSDTRQRFISGTKFLGLFFEKFDRDGISERYAKKHNLSQKEVLDGWERKGFISREVGTLVHDYLEQRLIHPEKDMPHEIASIHSDSDVTEMAIKRLKQADKALKELLLRYEFISAEKIVADLDGSRAGMIDLHLREKSTGLECLGDWKTNAKIDFENRWQSGIGCLSHLDDCSYNKYCLQMELYKQIGIKEGYFKNPMGDNVIIHIKDDNHDFIPCADMSKEIDAMIAA